MLLFIRHAESANNELGGPACADAARVVSEDLRRRDPDPSLSARGFDQAARLGERPEFGTPSTSTTLVVSPMRRACLTATPVAEALRRAGTQCTVLCHADYCEVGGCHDRGDPLPGRSIHELREEHPTLELEPVGFPSPDAGWYSAARAREADPNPRVERFYLWLSETLAAAPDAARIILVGHGEFMARVITRLLTGCPADREARPALWRVHCNTGVTTLHFARETATFSLTELNDVRHIADRAMLTGGDPVGDGGAALPGQPRYTYSVHDPAARPPTPMPHALRERTLAMRRDGLWSLEQGVTAASYEESDRRSVTVLCQPAGDGGGVSVAGHVQYDPATSRLRQLLVLPLHRRMGIGRALVARVVQLHDERHGAPTAQGRAAEVKEEAPPPRAAGEEASPRKRRHQSPTGGASAMDVDGVEALPRAETPPLLVHAHVRSEPFYARVGFVREGSSVYVSNGVECVKMVYAWGRD